MNRFQWVKGHGDLCAVDIVSKSQLSIIMTTIFYSTYQFYKVLHKHRNRRIPGKYMIYLQNESDLKEDDVTLQHHSSRGR